MKKGLMIALVVSIFSVANGQNKEIQNTQLYKHYQMKYVFGMKYNDGEVTKDALYSMIAMDPNDDSIKMRLCFYYFEQKQFASSLFVSADLLSRYADHTDALKINAMSYENLGIRDKAIEAYESLYLKTNEIGVLYQVAILQFEVERYTECKTNLDIIIKDPQAKALKLNFAKSETEQQEITLESASYNVKGMIEKQQGNKEEAKKHFEKALELEPEYMLATQNLKDLNK
ncbi:MAG: tetratricopeptide repeat protein [Cyclobacteriaceae bacterium]|nr:tetratricopeptide repeat protein [Cyclobacteriaceae bacterium]MCK5699855.1 tetratricopeptide repeat protein [Cyclobacteriaceae bacterium]